MKTTLVLPDDLYRDVKVSAALWGRSIASVVEEALRAFLQDPGVRDDLGELPVSSHQWKPSPELLAAGINIHNTSELLAWLDRLEDPAQ